jgi:hypothetical protein
MKVDIRLRAQDKPSIWEKIGWGLVRLGIVIMILGTIIMSFKDRLLGKNVFIVSIVLLIFGIFIASISSK